MAGHHCRSLQHVVDNVGSMKLQAAPPQNSSPDRILPRAARTALRRSATLYQTPLS